MGIVFVRRDIISLIKNVCNAQKAQPLILKHYYVNRDVSKIKHSPMVDANARKDTI